MKKLILASTMLSVAACTDAISSDVAQVEVALSMSGGLAASSPAFATAEASAGTIAGDNVASLTITITDIAFLPVIPEGDDTTEAVWQRFTLGAPIEVDLMALPTADDSALVIASGELPEGDYRQVRFFVSASSIRLLSTVSFGPAVFEADSLYPVDIPSGSQTGLKTDLTFHVGADTAVNLVFSPELTFKNVTATGKGVIKLAPVLKAKLE